MGETDYTSVFIHTETFNLGCGFCAGPVIIQIEVYLTMSRKELQGPPEVGYTVQYAYIARESLYSLVFDP